MRLTKHQQRVSPSKIIGSPIVAILR